MSKKAYPIGMTIVKGIAIALGKLPLKVHYSLCKAISWILRKIHYREDVVITNLARSFPEKKYWELRKIRREFYDHLGEIVAEAIFFGASDIDRLRQNGICHIANPQVLYEAFESAPSVTVMNGHCGNWEILGGILAYLDSTENIPVSKDNVKVAYKHLNNKFWDEFFRQNRSAPMPGYDGMLEMSQLVRYILENKDDKNVYFIINDQKPYKSGADIGLFMNQPTKAMMASARLACKLHHAVLYMYMDRTSRGHYEWKFVKITDDASTMTPEEVTRKYYDLLEMDLRSNPANYLWTHKRWNQ